MPKKEAQEPGFEDQSSYLELVTIGSGLTVTHLGDPSETGAYVEH